MEFCPDCGNTGFKVDGSRCTCGRGGIDVDNSIDCLTIPEEYRGTRFDSSLVNFDCGKSYPSFLRELYDDILFHNTVQHKNIFIGAPPKHSKTVLAYCCIQYLFRRAIPTFPLFDTGELARIISDTDSGRKPQLLDGLEANPKNIYDAPYLFVRITDNLSYSTFDTIALLIDRRTRRGHGTIFLYNGTWKYFIAADSKKRIASLQGDGYFGTIDVHSFWTEKEKEDEAKE